MSPIQRIICGDNLEVMKGIADESVDLVYIDPPFFTQKNYEVIWQDGAEIRQFNDRWITDKKSSEAKPTRSSKNIDVYLEWMEPRLKEIYRILKSTGSFYLHCDYHADAYLKILCDKIFGYDHFQADVIWNKGFRGTEQQRNYQRAHDHILFYTKSDDYTWNDQFQEYKDKDMKRYNKVDEEGRHYALIKRKRTNGEIYYGQCYPKDEGKRINDIIDVPTMASTSAERLGYPTQKPEALLECLIRASSNPGDIVMDCFCGCGTTIAVANRLNRQYIGIDVSPTACRLIAWRVYKYDGNKSKIENENSLKSFKGAQYIEGIPITSDEIEALDGNEFQNWVIREFGGFSGKRGADGGIDGNLGECLIQVKKYKAGRNDLDAFSGALLRNKAKEAIFIAVDFTKDFRGEVARLKRENEIVIHYFSIADILARRHYDIVAKFIPKHGLEKWVTSDEAPSV